MCKGTKQMEQQDFEKIYELFGKEWGLEAQLRIAVEEMSELTKEICKFIRYSKDAYQLNAGEKLQQTIENMQEEIADVLNCVEQIAYLFDKQKISQLREQKVNRALARLQQAKNNKGE
jgi:NTP pyrophosphatase (non-canonical NTP hydrolase)